MLARYRISCPFITVCILAAAVLLTPAIAICSENLYPPADYIRARLEHNDIVFLGTRHKRPPILDFIAKLIPSLRSVGVTRVGLEIPSDQQEAIDAFMKTGEGGGQDPVSPSIGPPQVPPPDLMPHRSGHRKSDCDQDLKSLWNSQRRPGEYSWHSCGRDENNARP